MKDRYYDIKYTTSKEKNGDAISSAENASEARAHAISDLRKAGHKNIRIVSVKRNFRTENIEEGMRLERSEWMDKRLRNAGYGLDAKIARIARGK